MDITQRSYRVVRDAEVALRSLIEEALREQRYSEVSHVAQLADRVASLHNTQATPAPSINRNPAEKSKKIAPKDAKTSVASAKSDAQRNSKKNSTSQKLTYPRFERDRDRLIKVGWSKKNKESYEHRAPREAVVAFVRHLSNQIKPNEVFSMDEILPVPDNTTGESVPDYQSYLTLAWLRDVKAIEKKGRDGYVLRINSLSNEHLDDLWNNLRERKV